MVTKGPNGNSRLAVTVRHLAPPDRLTPGAVGYVVWVTPLDAGSPQNVGALKLDSNLTGALNTTTALHQFKLTITAEITPTTQSPTTDAVITSTIVEK